MFVHKDLRWTNEGESPNHSDTHKNRLYNDHQCLQATLLPNNHSIPTSVLTSQHICWLLLLPAHKLGVWKQQREWKLPCTTSASYRTQRTQRSHAVSTQVDGTLELTRTWHLQAVATVISLTDVCLESSQSPNTDHR